MDWHLAIEKNREALKGILMMLVAMTGISDPLADAGISGERPDPRASGAAPKTLPRHLHRFVLRLLRPAEAAARRLIVVAARGLVVEVSLPRPRKPRQQRKPILVQNGLGQLVPAPQWPKPIRARVPTDPRSLSLPLLDPLKRWGRRRRVKQRSAPRITFDFDRPRDPAPPPLSPDDPLDAGRLHRRLDAIGRALDDLPRQARRLARWRARLDLERAAQDANHGSAGAQRKDRIRRLSPLRPGRPPGGRRQPRHAVDEVLTELHGLAVWAMARPDTS